MILLVTLVAAAAGTIVRPPEALAQSSATTKKSREHYKRGEEAYRKEDYRKAFEEFQAGYDLVPKPGFLLNLGQTARKLGDLRQARAFYKKYLLADPESNKRDSVEKLIAEIDSAIRDEEAALAATAPPAVENAPGGSSGPTASGTGEAKPSLPAAAEPGSGEKGASPAGADLTEARKEPGETSETGAPLWRRWWFWGAVGVVVLAGTGAAVAAAGSDGPTFHSSGTLGSLRR